MTDQYQAPIIACMGPIDECRRRQSIRSLGGEVCMLRAKSLSPAVGFWIAAHGLAHGTELLVIDGG
jgi:hypothetical protein